MGAEVHISEEDYNLLWLIRQEIGSETVDQYKARIDELVNIEIEHEFCEDKLEEANTRKLMDTKQAEILERLTKRFMNVPILELDRRIDQLFEAEAQVNRMALCKQQVTDEKNEELRDRITELQQDVAKYQKDMQCIKLIASVP